MRCLYQGRGTSDQSSTKLGHKMSLPGCGDGAMEWGLGLVQVWGQGVPNLCSTKLGQKRSLQGVYIWPEVSLLAVVPHLAKRCLYLKVCLTKGQPDLKQFQTWSLDFATGEMGVHLTKGQPAWSSSKHGHQMPLLEGMSDQRSSWPEVVPNVASRCLY